MTQHAAGNAGGDAPIAAGTSGDTNRILTTSMCRFRLISWLTHVLNDLSGIAG